MFNTMKSYIRFGVSLGCYFGINYKLGKYLVNKFGHDFIMGGDVPVMSLIMTITLFMYIPVYDCIHSCGNPYVQNDNTLGDNSHKIDWDYLSRDSNIVV
jgi:hypothetical protein